MADAGQRGHDHGASILAERFIDRHRATLDSALAAICDRGYWTCYPESQRAYG